MIPTSFVQELLARVDIVDVVGRHVELKKAGINHKGLCPFHGEKTPSFIVSPSRQTYHCFGCGAHGDAIRFLIEHTGAGFTEAVHDLAQQVGLTVPQDERRPEDRARAAQAREHQDTLSEVLAKAAAHWRRQLKGSERAVAYLKGRGLTGEIAARFGLGYAPEGWRGLASVFARYDDPLLVESGLVIVQGDGEDAKRYDRFRDRIMFPIRSVKGEVIGFGGRVLDGGEPKYLNSPETPVFIKGQELYGLYEARQAIRQAGYALVVEGYMDVVALAQSGLAHAVATLGTACTAEHVAKLLRFTDGVVFSFDGDAAGRRAAQRALEASLPHATDLRSIRFLFLPPEHDPDSFVRERGRAAFEQAVAQALPLSAMLLRTAQDGADLATPEGRARMLAQAKPLLALMPGGLLREQVLAELARQGGADVASLKALWASVGARGERGAPAAGGADAGAPSPASLRPRRSRSTALARTTVSLLDRVAWLLLHHAPLWDSLSANEHERLAGQPAPYGPYFGWIERCLHEHGPLSAAGLLDHLHEARAHGPSDALPDAALVERLSALLDPHVSADAESAAPVDPKARADAAAETGAALAAALRRLHVAEIDEEMSFILESGPPAGAALERFRELEALRRVLKGPAA
jgi:DNA primase